MNNDKAKRVNLAEQSGRIKRLHVDQRLIRQGLPAMTVQTSAGPLKATRVEILGPAVLVQSDSPLSCGAKVWVETSAALQADWDS